MGAFAERFVGSAREWKQVEAVDLRKPIVVKAVLGGLHHNYRRAA
jgi:hypothetical protein